MLFIINTSGNSAEGKIIVLIDIILVHRKVERVEIKARVQRGYAWCALRDWSF